MIQCRICKIHQLTQESIIVNNYREKIQENHPYSLLKMQLKTLEVILAKIISKMEALSLNNKTQVLTLQMKMIQEVKYKDQKELIFSIPIQVC